MEQVANSKSIVVTAMRAVVSDCTGSYREVCLSLIRKASYALIMFVLFIIVVGFLMTVLIPLLEKKAKGESGGVHLVGVLSIGFLAQAVVSYAKDLHKFSRKG